MATPLKMGLLIGAVMLVTACGNEKNCNPVGLTVSPATATADHAAAVPGNQVRFFAQAQVATGCVTAQCVNSCVPGLTWSVSDPVNVSISNNAADNGTATCVGATNGTVTVTATAPVATGSNQTVSGTALLTCL